MPNTNIAWNYHKIAQGSATHDALDDMEAAAGRFLDGMDRVYKGKEVVPYQVVVEKKLLGLTLLPENLGGCLTHQIAQIVQNNYKESFLLISRELTSTKHRFYLHNYNLNINGADFVATRQAPQALHGMLQAVKAMEVFSPDKTIADAFGACRGVKQISDPKTAVVISDGVTHFPEARKVFSDWIIAVPTKDGQETYRPPESTILSAHDLDEACAGLPYQEWRGEQMTARKVVQRLPALGII